MQSNDYKDKGIWNDDWFLNKNKTYQMSSGSQKSTKPKIVAETIKVDFYTHIKLNLFYYCTFSNKKKQQNQS